MQWFYTSDVARALATVHGFAPLPEFVMARVLDRLLNDIKCADGSLAKPEVNTSIPISYAGPRLLEAREQDRRCSVPGPDSHASLPSAHPNTFPQRNASLLLPPASVSGYESCATWKDFALLAACHWSLWPVIRVHERGPSCVLHPNRDR